MNAKICVLFNHKGGVSKTTTTFNLGWKISQMNKRVLLVDGDPQCNLTGLMMGAWFETYYTEEKTKYHNIKDGVRVAFEGKPSPIDALECYQSPRNPNLFLIPGHMDLAEYDGALSMAINSGNAISTLQNLPGAFYELIRVCCEKYDIDYVFIDMNPGLSAINQAFFIAADGFVIPTNPDPFAIMALKTLSNVLPRWKTWAQSARVLLSQATYRLPDAEMKFCGFIVQRFSIRNRKATRPFQNRIDEIHECVEKELVPRLQPFHMVNEGIQTVCQNYCIGEIPDFGALNQKAADKCVPVFALGRDMIEETGAAYNELNRKVGDLNEIFCKIALALIAQL